MNFDYTYIILFGFKIFEPMVIVTNGIFFALCTICYARLKKFPHYYSKHMSLFLLMLGSSSLFGAAGHAVHLQLGDFCFKVILFFMNLLSILSIYFCFRVSYMYQNLNNIPQKKYINLVKIWLVILLIACVIIENFVLITIHAGLVLIYMLIVHYLVNKEFPDKGNKYVIAGILISFISIGAHSLKITIHEWYNHKDLAHTGMIISLIFIYKGARRISQKLEALLS